MARCWILAATCLTAIILISGDNSVPRKMKQLYKLYKRYGVQGDVNTIRYIPAHKGSITSPSKLLFDLDSLHKHNETLIKAELHFYKRSTEAMSTIQIDAFEISSYYISLVERRRLSLAGEGWQIMNITDTVRQCTNTLNTNNRLGIAFSNINSDSVAVPVNMPQFLRHHDLPFLLLYSNNTRTLEMDQITDRTKLSAREMTEELQAMVNPKTGKLSSSESGIPDIHRTRRDIINNKIDEPELALIDRENVEDTYNEITNKIEVEKPNTDIVTDNDKSILEEPLIDVAEQKSKHEVQYIPWPKLRVKQKRAKSKKKRLPSIQEEAVMVSQACGRKSLRIHLEDIGWGRQIIEPKKIDAHYCSGTCSFPFSYGNQLTNHATLQSLVTTIRHKPKVPQPCCVPHKLQPITLLYYDEHQNIVLKTYPDMSVESCVCR